MVKLFDFDAQTLGTGTITSWADSSGNSRDLVLSSTGAAATIGTDANGKKYVQIQGKNKLLFSGTLGNSDAFNTALKAGFTLYVVVTLSDTHENSGTANYQTNPGFTLWNKTTTIGVTNNWLVLWDSYRTTPGLWRFWRNWGDATKMTGRVGKTQTCVLAVSRTSGGVFKYYIDGQYDGTYTGNTWSDTAIPALLSHGSTNDYGLSGNVYRIYANDSVQTQAQILAECDSLKSGLGMTASPVYNTTEVFVGIGNSLVQGTTNDSYTSMIPRTQDYLSSNYGVVMRTINYGVQGLLWSGLNTEITALTYMMEAGKKYHVFLYEDTNYLNALADNDTNATNCETAFEAACTNLRAAATTAGATVIIYGATPMYETWCATTLTDRVVTKRKTNGTASSGAKPNVLLDLNADAGLKYTVTPANWPDSVHPNATGQALIAQSYLAPAIMTQFTDTIAPTVASAALATDGRTLDITYSEGQSPPILPSSTVNGFTLTADGSSVSVGSGTRVSTLVTRHTLSSVVYQGQTLVLGYSSGNVTDSASSPNPLATFSGLSVSNGSTQPPPAAAGTANTGAVGLDGYSAFRR